MTLPFGGLEFPAMTYPSPDPPVWWPFGFHEASDLEETLSSWPDVRKWLVLGRKALRDFPGL